jgi:hypothetical protein
MKQSYIQQNVSMKESEHAELVGLMRKGWRAVNVLRLGIQEAKKLDEPVSFPSNPLV